MAGLGYPGGPVVDRLARTGRVVEPFSVARFKGGSLDLSFSGLKTAVRDRLSALGFSPNTGVALRGPALAEGDAPARFATSSPRSRRPLWPSSRTASTVSSRRPLSRS